MTRRDYLTASLPLLAACSSQSPRPTFTARTLDVRVGGEPAVELHAPAGADTGFTAAQLLPGRGMNIYQVKAILPGRGETSLFEAPPVSEAAARMNGGAEDVNGNQSFTVGGAILVPYANRIRGKLSADGKTLETKIAGKTVQLPANWKGRNPGAEPHAMHGLILDAKMGPVQVESEPDHASVSASYNAGNFGGHWLSESTVSVKATLSESRFGFEVTVKNTGKSQMPVGIGWHPYFVFPSGNREQARIYIPARWRALVDNYDNVFPTGQLVPVKGTPYDFSVPGGAPLGKLFLDDCFLQAERNAAGNTVAEIFDPAASYGLRIIGKSPEISAYQVYAPVDKPFVALEPQYNWADPYSPLWKDQKTQMAMLEPGAQTTYAIDLELFDVPR